MSKLNEAIDRAIYSISCGNLDWTLPLMVNIQKMLEAMREPDGCKACAPTPGKCIPTRDMIHCNECDRRVVQEQHPELGAEPRPKILTKEEEQDLTDRMDKAFFEGASGHKLYMQDEIKEKLKPLIELDHFCTFNCPPTPDAITKTLKNFGLDM